MAVYEIEMLGHTFEVDADSQTKAIGMARLHVAKMTSQSKTEAGAIQRGGAVDQAGKIVAGPSGGNEAYPRLPLGVELDPRTTEGKINNALAIASGSVPIVSAFRAAPLATSVSVAAGYGGSEIGGGAGSRVGGAAEDLGAPKGTKAVLRGVGTVAGGLVGGIKGPQIVQEVRGALSAAPAVAGAATKAVPSVEALQKVSAAVRAEAVAAGATEAEAHEAAKVAILSAIRSGAPAAAEAPVILPAGKRAMATNLGGKAKPGPPPTPPDQIEAALRASLESPMKGPRIQVGAQKVGREVGMTKEEVRKATGPILYEELGAASPALPLKAIKSIADKIRTLPMSEREAYVRAATSDKAMLNVHIIRAALESQGLLLPLAGATATIGTLAGRERK